MCFCGCSKYTCFFEETTQSGNLLDFETMDAGALEESLLGAYYKFISVVSVRLDLANLSNKVNYGTPTQIARQFAANQALQKVFMVVAKMIVHSDSISPAKAKYCF
jgi:hypothetical protein